MNVHETRIKKLVPMMLTSASRREAMLKLGYSSSYANTGNILTKKTFIKAMKPIVEQIEAERQRLLDELKVKDLSQVQYEGAVRSLDTLTKNIQLLSGKATENKEITINVDNDINEKNHE